MLKAIVSLLLIEDITLRDRYCCNLVFTSSMLLQNVKVKIVPECDNVES